MKKCDYKSKSDYDYSTAKEILTQKLLSANPDRILHEAHEGYPQTLRESDFSKVVAGCPASAPELIDNFHSDFSHYLESVSYFEKYKEGYKTLFLEKAYEHFIILKFLELSAGKNYVDIAACCSPLYKIAKSLYNVNSFAQDIMFPEGVHGDKIGCDACHLPFEDESIDAMSAACSIEHFENDADIALFKEVSRVLVSGGKFVVAPLYIARDPFIITDPVHGQDVNFSNDDNIVFVENWKNRYGRYYSPNSFYERIILSCPDLQFKIYGIKNLNTINSALYCNYFLVCTK